MSEPLDPVQMFRAKALAVCDPRYARELHRRADDLEQMLQPVTAWTIPS